MRDSIWRSVNEGKGCADRLFTLDSLSQRNLDDLLK